MDSLDFALTVCYNLGQLKLSLHNTGGGVSKLSNPTCEIFQIWPYLSFENF